MKKYSFSFGAAQIDQKAPSKRPVVTKRTKPQHKRFCHCKQCYDRYSRDFGGIQPTDYAMRISQVRKDLEDERLRQLASRTIELRRKRRR